MLWPLLKLDSEAIFRSPLPYSLAAALYSCGVIRNKQVLSTSGNELNSLTISREAWLFSTIYQ